MPKKILDIQNMAILFCCMILLFSCQPSADSGTSNSVKKKKINFGETNVAELEMEQLYSAIRMAGKLLVVYGDDTPENAKAYKAMLDKAKTDLRRIEIYQKGSSEVTKAEMSTVPTLLIGSTTSNQVIKEWQAKTPFKPTEKGFVFDGKTYEDAQQFFLLGIYPNPEADSMPIAMLAGNEDASLIQNLEGIYQSNWRRLLWNSWGYQVYDGNKRLVLGQFGTENGKPWQLEKTIHWDFTENESILESSAHFNFIKHGALEDALLINVLPQSEENLKKIEKFTGKQLGTKQISYHAYATSEEKGLLTNNTDQAHLDFKYFSSHTVINQEYLQNFIGAENRLVLRELLGKPKLNALEVGLGIHFTNQWQREGYQLWASKLFQSGNLIPLAELLDNELFEKESRLVFDCMAGVTIDFLIQEWGQEVFLSKYANWQPQSAEIKSLEPKWKQYFQTKITPYFTKSTQVRSFIPHHFKGFNFAHEGYNIYNGYNSKFAAKSLDALTDIGTNSVAIIPYTSMRDPQKPNFLNLSRFAGGETDESVVHSAFEAKRRNMHVLLKPQVWLGRGSWPGDVEMQTEADWQLFFDFYSRWMRHYALLAEIHEMDMLCLGVEFAKATIAKPKEWIALANRTRKIYSGKLTYAANWGDEVEKSTIWSAFDYVGVNCYYPLSKKDKPTDKELSDKFASTLEMLNKKLSIYQKPIIFTEIGFRSIEQVWKQPHAEPQGKQFEMDAQARCYRIVFENIQGKDWIKGTFWWKWPSYMEYAKRRETGFAPTNREAEKVVKEWFEKL